MKIKILVITLLFAISTSFAQDSNAPAFGKGLFNLVGKDSTFSMKIGFRMQILGIANWEEGNNNDLVDPETRFMIRRSRLKFEGFAYSPKLRYKVELGLSNRDISGASEFTSNAPRYILDAVAKWNFYENFDLWVGQTKLPGNLERVVSSANLQMVDRSLLNSRFNLDRDIGIQLRHQIDVSDNFVIREKFAISQGEGRNITSANLGGYQYTSRLELLPFGTFKGDYQGGDLQREPSPKLMIGATYDFNQDAVKNRSNQGSYMTIDDESGFYSTNISTFFLDAMFKYNGFSFMGEYAHRDAKDPLAKNSDGTLTGDKVQVGSGLNLQTGYLFKKNWEVSGRYTNITLDQDITGKAPENQYTLGLSKYIAGHKLKVQSDISYLSLDAGKDELMFRLQMDIHF
ncbi:Phosphate-selective porin O and P [Arenibacter nanhaiticus]|uniref:Phosphate-selective porin O and P n=1 Tax=Arenibacter nanhaiticus TaxID=558155 RepID=A0A1M6AIH1_9FLAO|nr:porin [Arenibacter nanhaiticus]SHI36003.1 Phosphate-selective porin O and P [Arenibacter nanhaiticus]